MLALGEGFSANQAKDAGLIWDIVGEEELESKTLELANRLAARAPEAMRITKSLIKGNPEAVRERIYEEANLFGERLRSTEARDAFMAFMSRKK